MFVYLLFYVNAVPSYFIRQLWNKYTYVYVLFMYNYCFQVVVTSFLDL